MITPAQWQANAHTFTHHDHPIFYRDDGSGGAVILALHGFPTSSWDWAAIWPGLTAKHRVIAPDLIGFGLSAKPQDYAYSIFDQADLAEALLRHCGVGEVHLLAHDYSDTIAQELIARQREGRLGFRLRSVCLLNGGIIPSVHRPRLMQKLLLSPLGRFIGPRMSLASLRKSFAPIFGPDTQPSEEELRGYWHFIQHHDGPRVLHRLIHYITERRAHAARWVEALREPGVPMRYIFGDLDPISGKHMTDALREINPSADIVNLPSIGHYPQCEAPEVVLRHYLAFLGEQ